MVSRMAASGPPPDTARQLWARLRLVCALAMTAARPLLRCRARRRARRGPAPAAGTTPPTTRAAARQAATTAARPRCRAHR